VEGDVFCHTIYRRFNADGLLYVPAGSVLGAPAPAELYLLAGSLVGALAPARL